MTGIDLLRQERSSSRFAYRGAGSARVAHRVMDLRNPLKTSENTVDGDKKITRFWHLRSHRPIKLNVPARIELTSPDGSMENRPTVT